MTQIFESTTQHVLPFIYETSYESLLDVFGNQQEYEIAEDIFKGPVKVHEYIKDNFRGDKGICRKINILADGRVPHLYNMNKRRNTYMSIRGNAENGNPRHFDFHLEGLTLYLFKSGVGFLVMSYDIKATDLLAYTETNYFLQALKQDNIREILFYKKVGKNQYDKEVISLLDTIKHALAPLEISSFMERGSQVALEEDGLFYPVEALVFSTVLLNQDAIPPKEINRCANLLSKGYKASYKCSEWSIDQSLIQGFDNLVWSVSREGVSTISALGKDPVTNQFLTNNYKASNALGAAHVYFYMYLMVLNQRYSLIKIATDINNKMRGLDFSKDRVEMKTSLIAIRSEIAQLMLTGTFFDISSNSQYHTFYEKVRYTLGVEALLNELEVEIAGLDSVTEILRLKDEEEKENRVKKLTKLGSLFAVFIGGWDLSEMIRQLLTEQSISYDHIPLTTYVAVLVVMVSIVVSYWIDRIER